MAHLGFLCYFWPFSVLRILTICLGRCAGQDIVRASLQGVLWAVDIEVQVVSLRNLNPFSNWVPKQGGPYSRASTSTLGTPSPSRQIGLISLETISCIPPFTLEIKGAAAGSGRGQQSTGSQALCQPAGICRTDWLLLCVSGKAGRQPEAPH